MCVCVCICERETEKESVSVILNQVEIAYERVSHSASQLLDGAVTDECYCECITFRSHRVAMLNHRCV